MPNRPQRNNNPGNLRFAGQREATGRDDLGFAVFPTPWAGWRALLAQIRLDQRRKLDIHGFLHKYAPLCENDTWAYIDFVCMEMNCSPFQALSELSAYGLAGVIACREGYFVKEE